MKLIEFARKPISFIILAPADAEIPSSFRSVKTNYENHSRILAEMQIMRGRIALKEGAVCASALDREGRHHMPGDAESWHLIRVDSANRIRGCARILVHPAGVGFSQMRLADSEQARNPLWSTRVRQAVEEEIASVEQRCWKIVEPGGWVVEEDCRCGTDSAGLALSAFAWSQLVGQCIAFVTATVNHGSASMLKRLGGQTLSHKGQDIPPYYDPAYGCEMEILRLQTSSLHSRFAASIEQLKAVLTSSVVLQAGQEPQLAAA